MSNIYPYTDYHELNLDWFLKRFKQLEEDWQSEKTVFDGEIAEALAIVRSAEAILTPVTAQADRAEQAAQVAQNNAVAAASSAAAASADANRASSYASNAILARNTAQNAAASAEESKQSATAAKNAAQNSATNASNAAQNAQTSANNAENSADAAMDSETEAKAAAAEAQRIKESIPEDYSDLVAEVGRKTEKVRIDFDGSNFTVAGETINYKQLYDYHITTPDFAFVVYGDRAYLLSYVQDGAGMQEMRFESTIAVTNSDNISNVKTSGIYVISSNGVDIASVRITDINSENKGYKVPEISDSNKNNTELYPSVKAVADIVLPLQKQTDEADKKLDILWKLNEGQTYDIIEQTESGMNDAPKGAKFMSMEKIYGKTEQGENPSPDNPQELHSIEEINIKINSVDGAVIDDRTITPPHPLNAVNEFKDLVDIERGVWEWRSSLKTVSFTTGSTGIGNINVSLFMDIDTSATTNLISNKFIAHASLTTPYHFRLNSAKKIMLFYAQPNTTYNNVDILYAINAITIPISLDDLAFLRSLELIPTDQHITITDQDGRDITYILEYIRKLNEVNS